MVDPNPVPKLLVSLSFTTARRVRLDELTDRSGLSPTDVWQAGDRRGDRDPRLHDSSGWRLTLGPRRTHDLPGALTELRELVDPGREALVAAAKELRLETTVSAHVYQPIVVLSMEPGDWVDATPDGTLPPQIVSWITGLGAGFNLDLYTDYEHTVDASTEEHP